MKVLSPTVKDHASSFVIPLIEQAFAEKKRKTGEPYTSHLYAVCDILIEAGVKQQYILDAALLHDILEDTYITKEFLQKHFGDVVTTIVVMLSKEHIWHTSYCKLKSYMYSLEMCAIYYPEVILIKMADRLHNLQTIDVFDLAKQKRYLKETEEHLLPIFEKTIEFTPNKEPFKKNYSLLLQEVSILKHKLYSIS